MKNRAFRTYYIFLFSLFFASVTLSAQVLPPTKQKKDSAKTILEEMVAKQVDTIKKDSISKLPYTFKSHQKSSLFLSDISSFEVIYDNITGQYIFVEKVGDFYIKHPFYMSQKEYEEYRLKRDMLDYFKDKLSAVGGKKKIVSWHKKTCCLNTT